MPLQDWLIALVLGGFFVLAGIGGIIWGKREETAYYNAIITRPDIREYLERKPRRPEPQALRIGGWIAIAVGLFLLGVGAYIFYV